jgi:hypothetical protein
MIVAIMANKEKGVYRFQRGKKIYYRLGNNIEDARAYLQRELRCEAGEIQILDGGKKQ